MPEVADGYCAVLWELPPGSPTHVFYIVTNMTSYKAGYTRELAKRMKGDAQFKGTIVVKAFPCGCPLPAIGTRPECVRETNWKKTHRRARLPLSEWFRDTDSHRAALRFLCGSDDRAMAIIDQVERNNRRQSA